MKRPCGLLYGSPTTRPSYRSQRGPGLSQGSYADLKLGGGMGGGMMGGGMMGGGMGGGMMGGGM